MNYELRITNYELFSYIHPWAELSQETVNFDKKVCLSCYNIK